MYNIGQRGTINTPLPYHNRTGGTIMTKPRLTQKRLKELLHYDPETGIFTWLKTGRGRRKNLIAGNIHTDSSGKKYIIICIKHKRYKAHRLAFLYMVGSFPINQTDHNDGNGLNNKFKNLSDATHLENHRNTRLQSNNTTGICGVNWIKDRDKWQSQITIKGRRKTLGYFTTKLAAAYARHIAEIKYNFHPNHGQIRPL